MSKTNLNIINADGQLRSWIDGISVYDAAGALHAIQEGDFVYNAAGELIPILREDVLSLGIRTSGATMQLIYSYNNDLLDNPNIVIMGSSTAMGFGLPSNQTIQYKLQQYANANWGGATINNIGVAGQWSTNWMPTAQGGTVGSNIDAALSYQPDFLLLMGPTNNAEHPEVDWLADLQTIIEYAQQRGVRVILMSPMPRTPYNLTRQQFLSDNAAAQLAALPYLMFNTFDSDVRRKDTSNPAEGNPIYFQADTFHLNDLGTTYVTDNFIIPFIEKQFRANTAYQNFIIEKSADGATGWTVFDTITDQQVTRKTYTKEPGYYRATATLKDGSMLPYSNVQQVTNSTPTADAGADQNPVSGTTSINIAGSGTDPDGTITGYLWEIVSGTGISLVNANTPTVTVNGMADGQSYTLRLTVTDNNGATGTDTVGITVAGEAVVQRILFDLAGGGAAVPNGPSAGGGLYTPNNTASNFPVGVDASGKYWNNGKSGAAGVWFEDPVDIENNVVTGLIIENDFLTSGNFVKPTPDLGMNYAGATTAIGDYPLSATGDGYYYYREDGAGAANPDERNLTITIPAGKTASVKLWGSRNASGTNRILQAKIDGDPDWTQEMNAAQNTDYDHALVWTGLTGTRVITLHVKVNQGFGHICVIDITLE